MPQYEYDHRKTKWKKKKQVGVEGREIERKAWKMGNGPIVLKKKIEEHSLSVILVCYF